MNVETARNQLRTAQDRLSNIESDLRAKEIEYDEAETSYAEIYARYSHKKRKPKTVALQREKPLKLRVELDALRKALGIYQDKNAEAERNLALCKLYDDQGRQFADQQEKSTEQTESINFAVSNLKAAIETFTNIASEFFQAPTGTIDLLRSFSQNPLFANVSLEDFLRGNIKPVSNNENTEFLNSQEKKLLKMASTVPLLSEDLLDQFNWWCRALVEFASNPTSIQRKSYVAPDRRPVQGITSQSFTVPQYARGGPEVDDKEDLRSDYWVRRRAALRQPINANTPVGKV